MKITRHTELEVFQKAFETAMMLFEVSREFPREELYSLTDQMRRSSRSVAANISEAWRKRRYEAAFVSKLRGRLKSKFQANLASMRRVAAMRIIVSLFSVRNS